MPNKKTLNVALLGALSAHLPMAEEQWLDSLRSGFAETFFEGNRKAFLIGRRAEGRRLKAETGNDMSKESQTVRRTQAEAMENVKRFFKNDKFAERANIELLSVSPGQARAKMTLHPHHLNGYGTVQGGAIFTLADFAFAAASNSHGKSPWPST